MSKSDPELKLEATWLREDRRSVVLSVLSRQS